MIIRRIPLVPVFPGWAALAALGGGYVVWEHQQGRHREPSAVCAVCWLNRLSPAQAPHGPAADPAGQAGPASQAGPATD